MEMSSRSAIGRSPSTMAGRGRACSSVNGPSSSARRQSVPTPLCSREIVPVSKPEPERAVRHHAGSLLAAPADQVAVVQTPASRTPAGANRRGGSPRIARSAPGRSSRRRSNRTVPASCSSRHGTPGVLDRYARGVRPVQLVQVDHVDAEASERRLAPARTCSGRNPEPSDAGASFDATRTWSRRPTSARARRSLRRPPCRRPRPCRSSSCPRRTPRASRRSRHPPTRSCPTCRRRPPTPRSRSP